MTYSVTFDRQVVQAATTSNLLSPARLLVTVTSIIGFSDPGVFTFMVNQVTGQPEYSGVATPADLQDFNLDAIGGMDFVRKSALDLVFETASQAELELSSIEFRLQGLCNDMDALDTLGASQSVTITSL